MMKIPILRPIEVIDFSRENLREIFNKHQVGELPYYIVLSMDDISVIRDSLDNIREVLRELNKHPRLPYPLYIVSDKISNHLDFAIVRDVNLLPKHYKVKGKRVKTKEQNLLNKVEMTAARIHNHPLDKGHAQIKNQAHLNRILKDMSVEVDFYQFVINRIRQREEAKFNKD
jgi:hypothetical protein